MFQAEEVACNETKCMQASPDPETGEERGLCTFEEEEDKNCKNNRETWTCEYIPCD